MQPSGISTKVLIPFDGSVILKSGLRLSGDFRIMPSLFSMLRLLILADLIWQFNIFDISETDGV
jgi:hypothetical protein